MSGPTTRNRDAVSHGPQGWRRREDRDHPDEAGGTAYAGGLAWSITEVARAQTLASAVLPFRVRTTTVTCFT